MSDTVHFKGIAKAIKGNPNDVAKQIMNDEGEHDLPTWCENWVEFLCDKHYQEYWVKSDCLFKIAKTKVDPDVDVFEAGDLGDGIIEFNVRYYNGGCSFDEALDKATEGFGW